MRLLITAAIFLAASIPAQASHRHHYHRHHHRQYAHYHHRQNTHHHVTARRSHPRAAGQEYQNKLANRRGNGMVRVQTAAGPIVVATHLAERFQALIADFVTAGYKPRNIGCLAHGGHVPHSRHYAGAACDFDQRGWGLTNSFMYHKAHAIIVKHGFRDGCSFSDCGHVDDGLSLRRHAHASWDDDNG